MECGYGGSELGFKSLTFSPFIITHHSLGMGLATDGEGREETLWLAINLNKLEMSRPTQPRQGAGGALISLPSAPLQHLCPQSLHTPPPTLPDVWLSPPPTTWTLRLFPLQTVGDDLAKVSQHGILWSPVI